ncbi:maleylpyruvate isomerase family mycothiol-dependent enzyme [Angustibacter sp. McL0619]|uniref:maleylpyruvate isomerase family mycothiol-dependent enzyme n=1 Tax=Angustibacter sp. McL0619 TaxID=3415676 RepID=UPI003CF61915
MTAFADDPILAQLCDQTDHLLQSVNELTDDDVHRPSLLPGWTRGHVLSHLARNADGLGNVARSAVTGQVTPMYESAQARDAGIEAGAGRSASELESDVESSAERFLALLADVPPAQLDLEVPSGRGPTIQVATLPWLRLREVVYHHVDLALGYTFADAPQVVLRGGLGECPGRLVDAGPGARIAVTHPDGSVEDVVIGDGARSLAGPAHAVLAWLTGRSDGAGVERVDAPEEALPTLPSWG